MIDVFIAGAQKAGTTSILRYLSEHQNIVSHEQMECGFFSLDSEYEKGLKFLKKKYGLFEKAHGLILAKQANFSSDPKAIERLAKLNPDCKLIFLTREPISRAFSSYQMIRKGNVHHESFDEVINHGLEDHDHWHYKHIIGYGCYSKLLDNLLDHFTKDQIKVVKFEALKESPQVITDGILDWIGLDRISIADKVYNSKDAVSLDPLQSVIGSNSVLKNLAIKFLGYRRAKQFAQKGSRLMFNPDTILNESLDDYPQTKAKLSDFYAEYNVELRSWGIKY